MRAPSWANTQPWEFAVVTGKELKAIPDAFVMRGAAAMQNSQSEVARPYDFPEPYSSRIKKMQAKERRGHTTEMKTEEMEARLLINFRNYGATTCIRDPAILESTGGFRFTKQIFQRICIFNERNKANIPTPESIFCDYKIQNNIAH